MTLYAQYSTLSLLDKGKVHTVSKEKTQCVERIPNSSIVTTRQEDYKPDTPYKELKPFRHLSAAATS